MMIVMRTTADDRKRQSQPGHQMKHAIQLADQSLLNSALRRNPVVHWQL
jgi:hypothetical protein